MARKAGNTPPRSPRGSRRRGSSRAADEPVLVDDSIGDQEAPAVEIEEFHPVDNDEAEASDSEFKLAQPADETSKESSDAGESGALVPLDPLGRYLAEIRRFPLLSR